MINDIHDNFNYENHSHSGAKIAEFDHHGLHYWIVAGSTNSGAINPPVGLYSINVSTIDADETNLFTVYAWQGGKLYKLLGKLHWENSILENTGQIATRVLETAITHANASKLLADIYAAGRKSGYIDGKLEIQAGMKHLLGIEQ